MLQKNSQIKDKSPLVVHNLKRQYKKVIIGASFYGCGLAATAPEDSLVIEPSILVGSDYTMNFNPGRNWDYLPEHPLAMAFLRELHERDALQGNLLHQPALCPIFSQWCLDTGIEVALSTRVLEIGNNELTIFNVEGRHQIIADEIIDTRQESGAEKRFTASLFTDGPECEGQYDDYEIVAGRFESEAFLLMPVTPETTYSEARMQLFNTWQKRPEKLKECSIAATGVRFDYNKYMNPVAALDAGLRGIK